MKRTEKTKAVKNSIESKNRKTLALGIAVLSFALIGVITVISLAVSFTVSLFDDSDQKARFEKFVSPVVMVDPVAFSDIKSADEHVLLMSSMWNLIINIGEETSYPEDEYGMMTIPSSDLDVSVANLFGSDVTLTHQTFGNSNMSFEYNSETMSYIVPPMGYSVPYQARVDKIEKSGKKRILTVAYISTNKSITSTEDVEPDKYMYYELLKTGRDKYIITAVLDSPDQSSNSSSKDTSSDTVSSGIAKTEE